MSLTSPDERARILEEARRQGCNRSRMNDPHWALGAVFFALGLVVILLSAGSLTDLRIDSISAIGAWLLLLGIYHRGRWKRRKVICVLQNVLAKQNATKGDELQTPHLASTPRADFPES